MSESERHETIEQLHTWFDPQHVDDVALYDITAQAPSPGALIIERRRGAVSDDNRRRWDAALRRVDAEKHFLNVDDRKQLIAQQHAWLQQARDLRRESHGRAPA